MRKVRKNYKYPPPEKQQIREVHNKRRIDWYLRLIFAISQIVGPILVLVNI